MAVHAQSNECPSCGKPLVTEAMVCIQCGYDRRKRRRLVTVKSVGRALGLSRVSGFQSFLTLILCMGFTALLVPMALRLPAWIEAEIVVGAWWGLWCIALTLFLYKGWLVMHDFEKPTISRPGPAKDSRSRSAWGNSWWYFPDFGGSGDGGEALIGCLALIVLIILLPFIIIFLIEATLLLTFVMYMLIRGMLAQVANSRLGCRGRFGKSLGYGVLWATVYSAPLAGLVWFAHRIHT